MPRLSGLASPHCFRCGSGLLSRERFPGLVLPRTLSGTARLCWWTMEATDADADMPPIGRAVSAAAAAGEGGRARFRGGRPFLEPPAEPSLALPSGGRGACNDGEKVHSTDVPACGDTLWIRPKCHCQQRYSLITDQSIGKIKGKAICVTVRGVYSKRCHCKLGHL